MLECLFISLSLHITLIVLPSSSTFSTAAMHTSHCTFNWIFYVCIGIDVSAWWIFILLSRHRLILLLLIPINRYNIDMCVQMTILNGCRLMKALEIRYTYSAQSHVIYEFSCFALIFFLFGFRWHSKSNGSNWVFRTIAGCNP